MSKVHDEPSEFAAKDGVLTVDGPGGAAVTLTPEAAAHTSDRLLAAATAAAGQRHAKRGDG